MREQGLLFTSQYGGDPYGLVAPLEFEPCAPVAPLVEDMLAHFRQLGRPFFLKYVCPRCVKSWSARCPGGLCFSPRATILNTSTIRAT